MRGMRAVRHVPVGRTGSVGAVRDVPHLQAATRGSPQCVERQLIRLSAVGTGVLITSGFGTWRRRSHKG